MPSVLSVQNQTLLCHTMPFERFERTDCGFSAMFSEMKLHASLYCSIEASKDFCASLSGSNLILAVTVTSDISENPRNNLVFMVLRRNFENLRDILQR